jgi:hypothetical protein
MARVLFESKDRDEAHRFQAKVIQDGTAPRACCTDHVERGDTTVVWDDNLLPGDIDKLTLLERA